MTKVPKIAVIGSNMIDLVTNIQRMPNEGETLEAPSFDLGFGGKGANQAVAAAKLGAEVVMVTKVGDDMFGRGVKENFAAFGIDTTYVEAVPGVTNGVAPIFVDEDGSNRILIVKGATTTSCRRMWTRLRIRCWAAILSCSSWKYLWRQSIGPLNSE